jgi:uncharacterized SAM-binding protein YcdF (DUF218 family)
MKPHWKKYFSSLKRILKFTLIGSGIVFILLCSLAFTRVPFDMQWWLGTSESSYKFTPDYVVMLGAGGMPEGENLIRLFYTLEAARTYPETKIILVQSLDSAVSNYMKRELMHHGIDSARIFVENSGTNTRGQGLAVSTDFSEALIKNTVIVTSPLHMRRAIKVFRKIGFSNVGGIPCFSQYTFPDLTYSHKKIGGKPYLPDVSASLKIRYNFWNYMGIQVGCMREFTALLYYKLNGWI